MHERSKWPLEGDIRMLSSQALRHVQGQRKWTSFQPALDCDTTTDLKTEGPGSSPARAWQPHGRRLLVGARPDPVDISPRSRPGVGGKLPGPLHGVRTPQEAARGAAAAGKQQQRAHMEQLEPESQDLEHCVGLKRERADEGHVGG